MNECLNHVIVMGERHLRRLCPASVEAIVFFTASARDVSAVIFETAATIARHALVEGMSR